MIESSENGSFYAAARFVSALSVDNVSELAVLRSTFGMLTEDLLISLDTYAAIKCFS